MALTIRFKKAVGKTYQAESTHDVDDALVANLGLVEGEDYEKVVGEEKLDKVIEDRIVKSLSGIDKTIAGVVEREIEKVAEQLKGRPAPELFNIIRQRGTDPFQEKFSFHRFIRGLLTKDWRNSPIEEKVLSANVATAGGYMVPKADTVGMVDLLYSQSRIRQLIGANNIIPVTNGDSIRLTRVTGGATAYWLSESNIIANAITQSQQTLGDLTLTVKPLCAAVPLSEILLQDASPETEGIIRRDIVRSVGQKEDRTFIQGQGIGSTPMGILNISGVNTPTNTGASVTKAQLLTDGFDYLSEMAMEPENDDADEIDGWLITPKLRHYIRTIRDGNQNYIWQPAPSQGAPETIWGTPTYRTNNARNETDATIHYIICGTWQTEAVIAQKGGLEIAVNESTGFLNMTTYIRVTERVDFNVRHPEAFCKMTVTGC